MLISLAVRQGTQERGVFVDPGEVVCISRREDCMIFILFRNGTELILPSHLDVGAMADAINAATRGATP